jgi:hypothetical protein
VHLLHFSDLRRSPDFQYAHLHNNKYSDKRALVLGRGFDLMIFDPLLCVDPDTTGDALIFNPNQTNHYLLLHFHNTHL